MLPPANNCPHAGHVTLFLIFASSKMTETCGCGIDDFQTISCKGLCRYLIEKKISQDVIQVFCDRRVCGAEFLKMGRADIASLIPELGDRIKLKNLQCHVRII